MEKKIVDNLDKGKTMHKKLAIKGHPTRGKEVIELLEMLGGNNIYNFSGFDGYAYYVIGGCKNEIRAGKYIFGGEDKYLFTIEEFLEKYPFKVGDKVVYTKFGDNCDDYPVTIESMKWTGTTIEYTFNDCVTCLAKDLKMWNGEPDAVISGIYLNSYDYADEVELNLGDYKIEVRDGRTYAVKKKPVYPNDYKKCCLIVGGIAFERHLQYDTTPSYKFEEDLRDSLEILRKLTICRNAYWKIAGEQMGLGKPWKPDYTDESYEQGSPIKYVIYYTGTHIIKGQKCTPSYILSFPTEEMRDTFYENFRNEIEQCKELL